MQQQLAYAANQNQKIVSNGKCTVSHIQSAESTVRSMHVSKHMCCKLFPLHQYIQFADVIMECADLDLHIACCP